MNKFTIRAHLATPVIRRGHCTLDALLMATLGRGDVSGLLKCVDGLYYASAGITPISSLSPQRVAFVASMRPEHTPEWLDVIKPRRGSNEVKIGLSRQREGGNVVNDYQATHVDFIEWHALGHADKVFAAIEHVPFIGKRRTSGYGEVHRWEVADSDLDGISGYADEPLRPVPSDRWTLGGDWVPVEAAWRAPYWDVRNRTKCFVPPGKVA